MTKRPVKKTAEQMLHEMDVRLNAHIDRLVSANADLNQRIGALEAIPAVAAESFEPSAEMTEDMLVGLWVSEQRDNGVTNVDLSIVDHIRTGIRLALNG